MIEENKELITEKVENTVVNKSEFVCPPITPTVQLAKEKLDMVTKAIGTFTKPVIDDILNEASRLSASTKPLVEHVLKEKAMLSDMSSTLTKLAMSYTQSLSSLSVAIQSMITLFSQIDYKPLLEIQCILPNLELDDIYLKELCKARWFPVRIMMESTSIDFFVDIMNVIDDTKLDSESRVKKLDEVFIDYYNKNALKDLKKTWETLNISPYMKKVLPESIDAYNRRQYALTVCALVTLWQGIIQEKAIGKQEWRTDEKTQKEFKMLITANDCSNLVKNYFDEYIFYSCNSSDNVKDDVPGRNSVCHSWYIKYPTRKTALNAILFTEFLLGLSPVKKEQKND